MPSPRSTELNCWISTIRCTGTLHTMKSTGKLAQYSLLRRHLPLVHEDLSTTYARNLHKWLLIAPIIGVMAGLTITLVAEILLRHVWPAVLNYYLLHHWAIVPGLVVGCALTGLIM